MPGFPWNAALRLLRRLQPRNGCLPTGVAAPGPLSAPQAITEQPSRGRCPGKTGAGGDTALRLRALAGPSPPFRVPLGQSRLPAGGACAARVAALGGRAGRRGAKMAGLRLAALGARVPCWRWGGAAVFGFRRGLSAWLAREPEGTPRWPPACRQKTSVSFLSRPELPNLAYKKLKGKSPGVIFIPGYLSDMNGTKALAIEEFCKSLGHACIRFDLSGVGNSDGNLQECTVGKWRKDVLSIIDDVAEGPQVKKEIEMKGMWDIPSKYSEEGIYHIQYSFIKEAEHHCLLHSPIPVNCPVRLLHGMKDDIIPWHTSIQVADRVVSTDVDVILRKHSDHRMKEKADIQLLVYTIDDLIDKLSTIVN
uniref:palmitoyl-protein thioesterase ABHD10, mitochondrial isoform X2 n=1 Tax=Nyctereutes procyonoides TaxID=34880 RepID=UPI0024451289|nr:palmitoyl-protein thioesterase ABHD10, mitochondrial isoform X2 [Nyctereutes procyonoides]